MTVNSHHEIDMAQINRQITGPSGSFAKYVVRRGLRVQTAAKKRCPVDHGRLRNSITLKITASPVEIVVEVGTDVEYAMAVHNGTGIFGPAGIEIRPTHGKFLVFQPKKWGANQYVFAPSVRGQKPVPFLQDALHEVAS